MKVEVVCKEVYQDLQLNKMVRVGDKLELDKARADELASKGLVEILTPIKEEKKEDKKKPTKKVEKAVKE